MPDQAPHEPMTATAEAAAAMHELYLTYVAAGFTETQALYLVAAVACGGPKAA